MHPASILSKEERHGSDAELLVNKMICELRQPDVVRQHWDYVFQNLESPPLSELVDSMMDDLFDLIKEDEFATQQILMHGGYLSCSFLSAMAENEEPFSEKLL